MGCVHSRSQTGRFLYLVTDAPVCDGDLPSHTGLRYRRRQDIVTVAVKRRSSTAWAAETVYSPGTVLQPLSQSWNVRFGSGIRTVTVSPGWASTFAKPASQRCGRDGSGVDGDTYTCTISRPERAPTLLTVTTASVASIASSSYVHVV